MAQGCRELEPERTGPTRLLACLVAEEQKVLIGCSHLSALRQVPSGSARPHLLSRVTLSRRPSWVFSRLKY